MKINIYSLENQIDFKQKTIAILSICNVIFYRNLINNINALVSGLESSENIVLTINEEEESLKTSAIVIFDVYNFDFNQKQIAVKLNEKILKVINQDDDGKEEIICQINNLKNKVISQVNDLDFEISYKEDVGISDFLKVLGIKIDEAQYSNIVERLFGIIDIVAGFELAKLIIMVNSKEFYLDEELVELYKYIAFRGLKLLIIERENDRVHLDLERRLVIDENFDEFLEE